MNEIERRLAEMNKTWEGDSATGGFTNLPPGVYLARIQLTEVRESAEGNLMIACEYLVLEGEASGTVGYSYTMLEKEWGPGQARRWMETLGWDFPMDARKLPGVVSAISEAAPSCRIRVTLSRNDYTNIRVLERLDDLEYEGKKEEPFPEPKPEPPIGHLESPPAPGMSAEDQELFDELQAFALAFDIAIEGMNTVEELEKTIKDHLPGIAPDELTDGERETLDKIDGIKLAKPIKEKEKKKKGRKAQERENIVKEAKLVDGLIALGVDYEIPIGPAESLEDVREIINEYRWAKEDLTAPEVKLLEKVGINVE